MYGLRKTTVHRKTMVLHVRARRLSVTKVGKWKRLICGGSRVACGVFNLCFYQNGICERWGRRGLSVIISID